MWSTVKDVDLLMWRKMLPRVRVDPQFWGVRTSSQGSETLTTLDSVVLAWSSHISVHFVVASPLVHLYFRDF